MRRVEAIVLISVLLALPLALLADGGAGAAMCNSYCCLPHGGRAAEMQMANHAMGDGKPGEAMDCHRGAAVHRVDCTMKSNSHGTVYASVAPLPVTNPSSATALVLPVVSGKAFIWVLQVANAGFSSAPFEPPRV